MTEQQMKIWIESFKQELKKMPELKDATEDELNKTVLDGLFEGFLRGELHRSDLALAASILGFEVSEDFMNDPTPDPIDLKNK